MSWNAPTDRSAYLAAGMADLPGDDRWMSAAEIERFGRMRYTKRKDEAKLARWTTKRAIAMATGGSMEPESLSAVVIRNAPDGAPEVEIGGIGAPFVISMTDRADWAVGALVGDGGRIGCDLELVEPRSARFVADYFVPAEQERVAAEPENAELLANLIWSAKESALKVLRTGLRRPTRSVVVNLGDEVVEGWGTLHVHDVEGAAYPGWWRRFGEFVLTVVTEHPNGPPHSLADPPPLEDAQPSHRWQQAPLIPPG